MFLLNFYFRSNICIQSFFVGCNLKKGLIRAIILNALSFERKMYVVHLSPKNLR